MTYVFSYCFPCVHSSRSREAIGVSKPILKYVQLYVTTYAYVFVITFSPAPPMTAPSITEITPLSNTSFTVSWTITDPDHNYIVTWTNLRTGMMSSVTVPENTNSHVVTGLNDVDNYSVTVTANNSCGIMMSDPATVYGKNIANSYIHTSCCYTSNKT